MTVHIVRAGETLYGIARGRGIRYWPNLYFAPENNEFRDTHPDPSRIFPNDRIGIPPSASIRPMERRPKLRFTNVPLFTQASETCWRATGKMLYCRRHRGPRAEAEFNRAIGETYRNQTTGLDHEFWPDFYVRCLGMRQATISSPGELHAIIATHGPAIVAIGTSASAHSMVMSEYDLFLGKWFVLDPAAGEELSFEEDVITVASPGAATPAPAAGAEDPARLTGYTTGPATLENMGRWLWILDKTVNKLVFYYE